MILNGHNIEAIVAQTIARERYAYARQMADMLRSARPLMFGPEYQAYVAIDAQRRAAVTSAHARRMMGIEP